jgi:hypothetical protein
MYIMQQETNSISLTEDNFGEILFFDILLTKMESNFFTNYRQKYMGFVAN